MTDWLRVRRDPIEAVEAGVQAADTAYESEHVGPVSYDRIDYPAVQVLPESTTRTDATNWQHQITVNLVYKWDRGIDYTDDVLDPAAAIIEAVLTELGGVDRVTNYHPTRIEDFSGELNGSLMYAMAIQFEVMSAVDPGTFS